MMKYSQNLLNIVYEWLGSEGLKFFSDMKEDYGRVDPVYMEGGIPHPVHFREGMQVRNFLRKQPECKNWTDHQFDDRWADIIEQVIKMEDPFDKAMEILK